MAEADLRGRGQGVLLLGISRARNGKREILIPTGTTGIELGDTLILLGNALMYEALRNQGLLPHQA